MSWETQEAACYFGISPVNQFVDKISTGVSIISSDLSFLLHGLNGTGSASLCDCPWRFYAFQSMGILQHYV